jgi:uncharacterized protein (TIGR02145 family)
LDWLQAGRVGNYTYTIEVWKDYGGALPVLVADGNSTLIVTPPTLPITLDVQEITVNAGITAYDLRVVEPGSSSTCGIYWDNLTVVIDITGNPGIAEITHPSLTFSPPDITTVSGHTLITINDFTYINNIPFILETLKAMNARPTPYPFTIKIYDDATSTLVAEGENQLIVIGCDPTIKDDNDDVYGVVGLAGYCWIKENLHTKLYMDGTDVVGYMVYDHFLYPAAQNEPIFGLLYTRAAVEGKEICPTGWRLPTTQEFIALTNTAANGYNANELRSSAYWLKPNVNSNAKDFNCHGAGFYNSASIYSTKFENILGLTMYWTDDNPGGAPSMNVVRLLANYAEFLPNYTGLAPGSAISVRCIQDY